jgi:hypothetical protein
MRAFSRGEGRLGLVITHAGETYAVLRDGAGRV